ncbi:unnamed protein product [Pieris brassicae]|uniref:Uncharacterized protein n=1 Tax=Pieris brassicae TaxID=7116 RepID=A0A9P0TB11_PIEBR|nr:unnamed protein product [Pieris brassicae]
MLFDIRCGNGIEYESMFDSTTQKAAWAKSTYPRLGSPALLRSEALAFATVFYQMKLPLPAFQIIIILRHSQMTCTFK